jgi:polar amino acid transport system substrate-binding protein
VGPIGRHSVTARVVAIVLLLMGRPLVEPARAQAAEAPEPPAAELVVGTLVAPPFAMRDAEGGWSGIAIELWQEVARRTGLTYRFQEYDEDTLLAAIEAGKVDVGVGPLLITPERVRVVDMTSPFMHIALAIATRPERGLWLAVRSLLTGRLAWATLGLGALLVFFAVLVWLLERHRNPAHFGGARLRGLGDAIWWSATTMTTVGYGDRTPSTFWGRAAGVAWMLLSIVVVSSFIAVVTSTFTVRQLQSSIRSFADLSRARTAAVADSGVADYLRDSGIAATTCPTIAACLDSLVAGEIDAVVAEWPILHWEARHRYPHVLAIVPQASARGFVAFALPRDSPRRRALDVALLQTLDDPAWRQIVRSYLPRTEAVGVAAP